LLLTGAELERLFSSIGRGLIALTAFMMITRRAQERAHSLKTGLPLTASSRPETKHCSAFSRSAVQQKREQVEAVHVLVKDLAEIVAACVRRGFRDLFCDLPDDLLIAFT
jgi:hypothetical protein